MDNKIKELVLVESNFKIDLSKLSKDILEKGNEVIQKMEITINKSEQTNVIKIIIDIKGNFNGVEFLKVSLVYLASLHRNEEMTEEKSKIIFKEVYPKIKEQIEDFYRKSPYSDLKAPPF